MGLWCLRYAAALASRPGQRRVAGSWDVAFANTHLRMYRLGQVTDGMQALRDPLVVDHFDTASASQFHR